MREDNLVRELILRIKIKMLFLIFFEYFIYIVKKVFFDFFICFCKYFKINDSLIKKLVFLVINLL